MNGEVVVIEVGGRRRSLLTARVREVAALGTLTPVPTAPPLVVGLTQLRGQILPVLDPAGPAATSGPEPGTERAPRPGDPLLVVELGPVRAALWVERVLGVERESDAPPLDVGALFDELRQRGQP